MEAPRSRLIRFGVFELDVRTRELRKRGQKVKLQDQPGQVLVALLEHPGEVITRDELRQRIWPADTFVDFDLSLNAAIKRLRLALGDSADSPRFVETLPRLGYRFIATIEETAGPQLGAQASASSFLGKGEDSRRSSAWLRKTVIAAAALLLISVFGGWWWTSHDQHTYRIAVIPFKNLSSEPGSDYFSDGLTDEIIRNLSIIDRLQVKSRTSSFTFKDKPLNIRDVGKQLDVNYVLEGSVLRSGSMLRVNTQLIRVSDDAPVWSGRFDRELKDVFAIQDEISRSVVNELRLKLGSGQRRYNTDIETYELYLRAQTLAQRLTTETSKEEYLADVKLFNEVIARDPGFAPAYAGLAATYAHGTVAPANYAFSIDEAYGKMREASEKALQIDPLLAEAHASMGLVQSRDHAWGEAEKSFRRALELNPNLSGERTDYAFWVLYPLGRIEESVRELRAAVALDPLSPRPLRNLAWVLVSAGKPGEAIEICRSILANDPHEGTMNLNLGRALLLQGRVSEAIKVFEDREKDPGSQGYVGYAYARLGRRAEAEQLAAQNTNFPHRQVLIYAGLGDKDRAFDALNRALAMKVQQLDWYPLLPELADLRGDPRMAEFRRKLNLPPP